MDIPPFDGVPVLFDDFTVWFVPSDWGVISNMVTFEFVTSPCPNCPNTMTMNASLFALATASASESASATATVSAST